MPRIVGPLLTCTFVYLYLCCAGIYCQYRMPGITCTKPHWFRCANGQCIPYTFECDGDPDCVDGSDEKNCTGFQFHNPINSHCAVDEFKCDNNDCIPSGKFCDLMVDCADGSDEHVNCTQKLICSEGTFRCQNGHCVSETWRCDGTPDCPDGSDEINCDNATIPVSECKLEHDLYLCPNQRCIPLVKACDGKDDCGDGQDEKGLCLNDTLCQLANCNQDCRKTPRGAVCVCRSGYKLTNNRTCGDIDECETYGICDHYCVNIVGSYNCYCENNYVLQEDRKTCKATSGEATLIFSSRTEIRGVHLESQIYFSVAENLNNSASVAIDGDFVYWSQGLEGDQMIVKMEGWEDKTKKDIVRIGLHTVSGIAIDYITGNVYFTDDVYMRIGVCDNEGLSCIVLIKEEKSNPRGIALLPTTGTMYWCDWGSRPHIAQAGMDGRDMSLFVTDNLAWPNSATIDYPSDRLYWVDAKLRLVESISLDGTDRRAILQHVVKHPFSIAVFENKLYWSDWDTNTIQYCDKFTGKNWTTLVRTSNTPFGIHIDHSAIKPKFKNPCMPNPCFDLCLLKKNHGYTCACTMDKKLNADNHTCQDGHNDHVIIIADNMILEYYHGMIGIPKTYALMNWHHVSAATYDSLTGTILLSDRLLNRIIAYDPANSEHGTYPFIYLDIKDIVKSMAYDYIGNNLYMSFERSKIIQVINLDSFKKTVFYFDLHPQDILLVPEEGMMFVVFAKQNLYHIDRFRMDATSTDQPSVRGEFKFKTSHMGPKISLCYDNEKKVVFLSDQATGFIWSFSIKDLQIQFHHNGIRQPTNLILAEKYLYWSETKSTILSWINKNDPLTSEHLDLRNFGIHDQIMHLVTLRNVSVQGEYGCRMNNGNCSHVCLTTSATSFVCACPSDMALSGNHRTCLHLMDCPANKIRCKDHNICIDRNKWCDGVKDCPYNDDEPLHCNVSHHCGKDQFMCEDGMCVEMTDRCDWHFDCPDKSDEKGCAEWKKCAFDEFACDNGECIENYLACNGRFDCIDLSDELNCINHTCQVSDFKCTETRQCIPTDWKCDGEADCEDESDEMECDYHKCNEGDFMCENGVCISSSLRCNNIDDCNDNSDEQDCWMDGRKLQYGDCNDNEYLCADTDICIPQHLKCNGVQDCPKNDDEHHCKSCLGNEFVCTNNKCLPHVWVCDGFNDCGDNADEEKCDHGVPQIEVELNVTTKCDEFQCASTGTCLSYSKVCDSFPDCLDGSDERGKCTVACVRDNVCDELCLKTPQGGVCACNEGYRLDTDGQSCIDVNECENVPCAQICDNVNGSYKCSCYDGHILRKNGISCKSYGSPMEIFAPVDNDIRKISLNFHSVNVINVSSNADITGIDVNAINNIVYWTNAELGNINKMNLETGNISTLSDTSSYPTNLIVDWITNNVYFNNKIHLNAIKVCNFEKRKCATVIRRDIKIQIMALQIDPINRWLYWSETDRKTRKHGKIFRAYMKGTHIQAIVKNVTNVNGLAIDHMKSKLYWSDFANKVIESSNFDGTERRRFLKLNDYPMDIEIFENSLYLLTNAKGHIQKCLLYDNYTCDTFLVGANNIHKQFAIKHISRHPYVDNFCEKNKCHHICILDVTDTYVCMCRNGKLVKPDEPCKHEENQTHAKSHNNGKHRSNSSIAITITILFTVAILFAIAYCYSKKHKFRLRFNSRLRNSEFSNLRGVHFQNPAFDRRDEVSVVLDQSSSNLTPGRHEYVNPIDETLIQAAEECSIEKLRQTSQEQPTETEDQENSLISFIWKTN